MIQAIGKLMPVIGTTEDFDGSEGGIWLSGENGYKDDSGVQYFDYYNDSEAYELGVLSTLVKFAEDKGWYFEWYDSGTIILTT